MEHRDYRSPRPATSAIPSAPPSGPASAPCPTHPTSDTATSIARDTPQRRGPKLAALFKKPHERDPAPIRATEASFIDTHFDVEDAAAYHDALLILESLATRTSYLTPHQTRLLLCLALFPLLFRPPEQRSATHHSSRSHVGQPPTGSSGPAQTTGLVARSDDPTVLSHRRIRETARGMLADALGERRGADLVGEAVPGYGLPRRQDIGDDGLGEMEASSRSDEEKGPLRKKARMQRTLDQSTGKVRASGASAGVAEGTGPHEGDDALSLATNRILLDAPDLWDILAGTTARRERVRKAEQPLLEAGGWELVRVLAKAWEDEADRLAAEAKADAQDRPEPLSLLRQFQPSASTSAARSISHKALDIIFWPFTYGTQEKEAGDESATEEDARSNASSGVAPEANRERISSLRASRETAQDRAEMDGTNLADKREVGVRLLKVIGDTAVQGYLEPESTVSEVVQRVKALAQQEFIVFIEASRTLLSLVSTPISNLVLNGSSKQLLAVIPTAPVFTIRLLLAYLEHHSHPAGAVAGLVQGLPPSETTSGQAPQPVSPRRLAAAASLSKRDAAAAPSYWRIPSLASPAQLVAAAQRIPRDVPISALDPVPALNPSSEKDRTEAVGCDSLPRRAQDEVHRFVLIKDALVELILSQATASEFEENAEGVLQQVREAMARIHEVVQAADGQP